MTQWEEKLGARGEVYRFLSHAYYPPEEAWLTADFTSAVKEAFKAIETGPLAREIEKIESYLQGRGEAPDLSIEYTRLFRGPIRAEAYPYESMYVEGEVMGQSTRDVVRRYAEAGVEVSEDFKDLPDHVSAELEFMHYLCAQELAARRTEDWVEAARFRHMNQSFLADHLSQWIYKLTDCILQNATTPYYLSLAQITREFIRRETAAACPETVA